MKTDIFIKSTFCKNCYYFYCFRKIWENSSKTGCAEMLKFQAVRIVSELLTSKCKEIVLAVLRAQASFLSNAANLKHPTNNLFVISQVSNK